MSSSPNPPPRSARDVIDEAIRENRFGERLLYGFAVVFVLAGVAALIVGMVQSDGVVALAGGNLFGAVLPRFPHGPADS
jgi:hypothetical protein